MKANEILNVIAECVDDGLETKFDYLTEEFELKVEGGHI